MELKQFYRLSGRNLDRTGALSLMRLTQFYWPSEEAEEVEPKEQPNFGLGLKRRRTTRSSNTVLNVEGEYTPGPPSRSPRIIIML